MSIGQGPSADWPTYGACRFFLRMRVAIHACLSARAPLYAPLSARPGLEGHARPRLLAVLTRVRVGPSSFSFGWGRFHPVRMGKREP